VRAVGEYHAGREQKRVAGQEHPDDERALEENEGEDDGPHRDRPGLVERPGKGELLCGGDGHRAPE
jgi:hypothetical protein